MSAIDQYVELFQSNRDAVMAHSAGALNALRDDALRALSGARLPEKGDEDYEVTDLETVFAPDYGVNINRIDLGVNPADAFRCDVPNLSTCLFFLLNDAFFPGKNAENALPEGVIVTSLAKAAEEYPALVGKYYGRAAALSCPQTALNTLLAQDGIFIYVPKGVVVEKPVQIVNVLNSAAPLMVNRRLLIVADDDAQVRVLACDHTQNGQTAYLNSQVIEIFAGKRAVIDYYDIEDSSHATHRVSSLYLRQEEQSSLMVDGITLLNGMTRNNYVADLAGDRTELRLLGMAIAADDCHIDNHTVVTHSAKRGYTDELFKYVLDGRAVGSFSGLIKVCPGAEKTEAYQSNKNVCASQQARMYSKPQLLIDCDDVKCNHGSSIGQIDQNALFYMQARGIPEREARLMLMQAFMNDVIAGIRLESLKDRLRHLVESHILGGSASCRDCVGSCQNSKNKENA